jgi:uncharacterized protein YaeQ
MLRDARMFVLVLAWHCCMANENIAASRTFASEAESLSWRLNL